MVLCTRYGSQAIPYVETYQVGMEGGVESNQYKELICQINYINKYRVFYKFINRLLLSIDTNQVEIIMGRRQLILFSSQLYQQKVYLILSTYRYPL